MIRSILIALAAAVFAISIGGCSVQVTCDTYRECHELYKDTKEGLDRW